MYSDVELIKIYNDDYIGNHMGTTKLTRKYGKNPSYYLDNFRRLGLRIRTDVEKTIKYNFNESYFDIINSENKAYWLGFMMADGFISHKLNTQSYKLGISLKGDDKEHLYKFKYDINAEAPIKEYTVSSGYKVGSKYCRIMLTSHKTFNDLIKHGCVEHKTNILLPPIDLPEEYECAFIRGYFDADGCITRSLSKGRYVYKVKFIGTDIFDDWIMDILLKNNIINRKYPLSKRKPEQIVSSFEFGGNKLAKKFYDWIYGNANIYLDRKYNKYLELLEYVA